VRVDAVSLGKAPHRLGEVARLLRVYHRHRQASPLQCAGQGRLVAASGLRDHQRDAQRLQRRSEHRMAFGVVCEALGAKLGAERSHVQVRLGCINSDNY
jgi:hypothetical protein